MKRFILTGFKFAVFSAVIYVGLIILFGFYAPGFLKKNLIFKMGIPAGNTFTKLKEADTTSNIDILFIGSSHSYRGYDPRIFSENYGRAFNMGSSAQTPIQTELIISKYLDQLNPKIVIFDIYPAVFESDGVESAIDIVTNGTIDLNTFLMVLKVKSIKVVNTFIYALFRQIVGLDKNFSEPKVKNGDIYVGHGYVETFKKYKSKGTIKPKSYSLSASQVKAFERIVENLKKRNINFYLVQAPMAVRKYEGYQNNNKIDSMLMSYGRYYNFNKILTLPDSMFFDDSHLNQLGVNIFNRKLLEVIDLPGKKNEVHNLTTTGTQ